MKREPVWRRYLRLFGADASADFDDELSFHLETKIDELTAAGYPPAQARAEALRQFGPVRGVRRKCIRIRRGRERRASLADYLSALLADFRHALRSLARMGGLTLSALSILALSLGAAIALFTLLDRLLMAPLPVSHPSQLLRFAVAIPPAPGSVAARATEHFTSEEFDRLRANNSGFSAIAAEALRVVEHHGPSRIDHPADGLAVSSNYFETLGVTAACGRLFASGPDWPEAVISDRFWARRFQRSPNAIGATLYLNDRPYRVSGVLPRGFFGLHRAADSDVYVSLTALPPDSANIFHDGRWLGLFGRIRPGMPLTAATQNLQALMPSETRIQAFDLSSGTPGAWGEQRRSLTILAAIVGLLLLMGCVNVAYLLLARGAVRAQETAIRLSLGGKRTRVLRQALLESCLLSLGSAALGVALSLLIDRLLITAFQWRDRPLDLAPDPRVLVFALALSLLTGILFGLAPAIQLWRAGRLALTRERALTPRFGLGRALVVAEVALSLVLVAAAAVFLRSFENLRAVPTGFSANRVSYIELGNAAAPDSLKAPYREAPLIVDSLRHAPSIEAAGLSDLLPFDDGSIDYPVVLPENREAYSRNAHLLRVDASYFDALRIPIQAGRNFIPSDGAAAPKVAILTEGTARRLFHGENPLGRRIILGRHRQPAPDDETEIVGVVNDIKFGSVTAPAPDVVFQPLAQGEANGATTSTLKLQVRSRLAESQVVALIRSRIRDMGLPVTVEHSAPLEDAIAHSVLNDRIRMQASAVFGIVALLLIAAGLYGLLAYTVATRTREIGIRMAVGSRPAAIVAMVFRQGLVLTAAGVMVGLPAVLVVMKALTKLAFGLAPIDWTSIALAAAILLSTGILATLAPALKAAHLDPVEALRVE